MKIGPGMLLAEEPRRGYLTLKLLSVAIAGLLSTVDGWFLYSYIKGQVNFDAAVGIILITLPLLVGLLAIGPFLRRQRARLYERAFAPPYKPLSYFLRGKGYLVPLETVTRTEYRHGKTHLLVTTSDGRTSIFWAGSVGSDFYQKLPDYFESDLGS